MQTKILLLTLLPISLSLLYTAYGEELKILESQLNKNSITGVLQNPYNHTVGAMTVRAEFYDKDGHLVGLRDFGYVTREELKPNEKSSFKIYEHAGETEEFPKTNYTVMADGIDFTNAKDVSGEEQIKSIEDLTKSLKNIPNVDVLVTVDKNNNTKIVNVTGTPQDNSNPN